MIGVRAWPVYVVCIVTVVFLLGGVVPRAEGWSSPDPVARQVGFLSVVPMHHLAAPVVDRDPLHRATPLPGRSRAENDLALRDAWYSNGCHLNPGIPLCVMVSVAAQCTPGTAASGCDDDLDGDGCK